MGFAKRADLCQVRQGKGVDRLGPHVQLFGAKVNSVSPGINSCLQAFKGPRRGQEFGNGGAHRVAEKRAKRGRNRDKRDDFGQEKLFRESSIVSREWSRSKLRRYFTQRRKDGTLGRKETLWHLKTPPNPYSLIPDPYPIGGCHEFEPSLYRVCTEFELSL